MSAELKTLGDPIVDRITQFYRHNEQYLSQILQESLKRACTFKGNSDAMARLIFSLMQGSLLVTRADGGVARLKETIQQMMLSIES